jgi:hypothetical protein
MCLVNQLANFGVFYFQIQLGIILDFEYLCHKRAYVRCEYRFSQFDDILVFRVLIVVLNFPQGLCVFPLLIYDVITSCVVSLCLFARFFLTFNKGIFGCNTL